MQSESNSGSGASEARGLDGQNGHPPRRLHVHGDARELRRVLGSIDRVTAGLDEYTQRKVRILVGELMAQSRDSDSPEDLDLGVEVHGGHVRIEVAGNGFAPGHNAGEGNGALEEWSNWLVESVTDESSRSGKGLCFVIERRVAV